MKKILLIITCAIFALTAGSCDRDAKFETHIPVHPLQDVVLSASATCQGETVVGDVDNTAHTIKFVFTDADDFSQVKMKLHFAARAILKEGATEDQTVNLKDNTYSFVANNTENDITYTVSAAKASVVEVDRTQCSVVKGLAGDADSSVYCKDPADPKYLFDGKWLSKKNAYSEVSYKYFGWTVAYNQAGHNNVFTFSTGSAMRLAKMIVRPYWGYCNNDPAEFEIYAYNLPGAPTGDWANWKLIATVNDADKWQITKSAVAGSADDQVVNGTVVEFKYDPENLPEAQYYRFKVVKNFFSEFGTSMSSLWSVRVNWFTISEIQLWRYNIDE
jgi:hypothetical protein